MSTQFTTILDLPKRPKKKRKTGITHVLDKGMGLNNTRDLLETCSGYIDIVKLGWGTGFVTENCKEKIKLFQEAGISVCFGGTLVELVLIQHKLKDFLKLIDKLKINHIEISDGVVDMPRKRKAALIKSLSKDYVVLSEVGSKDGDEIFAPYQWIEMIEADLEAGAWKVILEARESGTAGICRKTGEVRYGLIDEVVTKIKTSDIIFEAPLKAQQVWFIKKFGTNVNLGNIAPAEVIPLETLRLGMRGDTLEKFHL